MKSLIYNKSVFNNPIFKRMVLHKYGKLSRNMKPGVMIETTSACNSNCPICHRKDMNHFMSMDIFKKIVLDCKDAGIDFVWMSVYGEPLIDPEFLDRIEILSKNNIEYGMYTNASLLNKRFSEKLLKLGNLSVIKFSVLGFSEEVYQKMMPGLSRNETYSNINTFLDLNEASRTVRVSVRFIETNYNRAETSKWISYWKQTRVDEIEVSGMLDRFGGHKPKGLGPLGQQNNTELWHLPCVELFGNLNIYSDGRVSPCNIDNDKRRLIVGNVTEQSVSQIYFGKKMQELRKIHAENKRHLHPICGQCHDLYYW